MKQQIIRGNWHFSPFSYDVVADGDVVSKSTDLLQMDVYRTIQIAHQGFWIFNWLKSITLEMASARVFETSVTNYSPSHEWSFSNKECYFWFQTIFSQAVK